MKVLLAQEMRGAENAAINRFGIPSLALMEMAGKGIAEEACKFLSISCPTFSSRKATETKGNIPPVIPPLFSKLKPLQLDDKVNGKRIIIFAGLGNNGGDGFVAARYLASFGIPVTVILTGNLDKLSHDAKINFNKIDTAKVNCFLWEEVNSQSILGNTALIIDALLGTGLSREVSSPYLEIISFINDNRIPILSVDIPSGVSADTGEIHGIGVIANKTVTMGVLKRGLLLFPGRSYAGEIVVIDIGLPDDLPEITNASAWTMTAGEAGKLLPHRSHEAHKGDCGCLLVVGGSTGMVGAPALVCKGALRAGTGLVTAAVPKEIASAFHPMIPESMSLPLPSTIATIPSIIATIPSTISTKSNRASLAHKDFLSKINKFNAVVVGPGLNVNKKFLVDFLKAVSFSSIGAAVIDAGALDVILEVVKDKKNKESKRNNQWVITPHEGELARMLMISPSEVRKQRVYLVESLSKCWDTTIVLKGAATIVGKTGYPLYINSSGNPGMATAGSGDVLSGVIGGLAAQGKNIWEAATLGVFLHGLAGDKAVAELGETGILATDIAERLPFVFQEARRASMVSIYINSLEHSEPMIKS